jgi:coenzyme F420-reducing hydrogenase beta subunit
MPELAVLDHCTGCTACAAACPKDCITMQPDADGFFRPVIDRSRCVNCGLCEKVCPVLVPTAPSHTPAAFAAWSREDASRLKSTSGGVFPELARSVLARGGAVYGAAYDENFRVIHICAENAAELDRLRGAKYAQSDLGDCFREAKGRLEAGQEVLFSGTPCQILGLKAFLRKDYVSLLTVDLVCHSVPSPLAWENYLRWISDGKTISAINLRCKDTGWSRYRYSNRFEFSDGSCRMDQSGESLYMKLFGSGLISRPSCSGCPAKGYARVSDLTLGDFWGIWNSHPELDDDRGVSLVLVHSEKGLAALGQLPRQAVSLEDAGRENPAIFRPAAKNPLQQQTMALVRSGSFPEAAKLLPAAPKPPSLLRRGLGLLKRKLLGR